MGRTKGKLCSEQESYPYLKCFKELLKQYPEGKPIAKSVNAKDVNVFYVQWEDFLLTDGILYNVQNLTEGHPDMWCLFLSVDKSYIISTRTPWLVTEECVELRLQRSQGSIG